VDWLSCQKPGLIDLARVPKDQVLDRNAYTYIAGMKNGQATWIDDVMDRKPVFGNPDGVGWCINVCYNEDLRRYMLTSEHTETHRGNIGIFDAPDPWGPWTTVCYQERWWEGHVPLNTYYWNFSNKWIIEDGKTFSLIFTRRRENDSFNVIRGEFITHRTDLEIF
jgi:hypothetical protein